MKLKLLIAPLLVMLIVVISIWVIMPAYQNLQVQKETLATTETKLADIQEKNKKAASLRQELTSNNVQKDVVFSYVPIAAQEETIIESIDQLAKGEKLVTSNISLASDTGKGNAQVAPVAGDGSVVSTTTENLITFSVSVSGAYEEIKSFLGKLAKLKRFNNIVSMKITPAEDGSANKLTADLMVSFAYLPNLNLVVNVNNSIFSTGKFDTSVIDQIKKDLTTDVFAVTVGTTHKDNPFRP